MFKKLGLGLIFLTFAHSLYAIYNDIDYSGPSEAGLLLITFVAFGFGTWLFSLGLEIGGG